MLLKEEDYGKKRGGNDNWERGEGRERVEDGGLGKGEGGKW